jgi:hypothetical protein
LEPERRYFVVVVDGTVAVRGTVVTPVGGTPVPVPVGAL